MGTGIFRRKIRRKTAQCFIETCNIVHLQYKMRNNIFPKQASQIGFRSADDQENFMLQEIKPKLILEGINNLRTYLKPTNTK